jgi:hypothetical protein
MEAEDSPETVVPTYRTTMNHIPRDRNLDTHRHKTTQHDTSSELSGLNWEETRFEFRPGNGCTNCRIFMAFFNPSVKITRLNHTETQARSIHFLPGLSSHWYQPLWPVFHFWKQHMRYIEKLILKVKERKKEAALLRFGYLVRGSLLLR